MTEVGPSPTHQLAGFLAKTNFEDIPQVVRERAKYLTLDGVVCGLLSAKLDWSVKAVETLRALDGPGSSTVWGWPTKVPPMSAALLNGTFVQGFELDDYHPDGPLHSQACTLPAVFGTAEAVGSVSGRKILEAIVLGFEVGPRIGMAMGGLQLVTRGWHCGAIYGVLSGAVGAGKVRNLDAAQFEDAIGLAATQACGLMSAQFEAMVKRMHSGMAARSGVLAAALAGNGFTGIKRVLERDFGGFVPTFCGVDPFDLSRLTNNLGTDWEVLRIAAKPPYSTMAGTHSAIEGAMLLRNRPGFEVQDIASIRIGTSESMLHHGGFKLERPATAIGAQMSHRYIVAVTLLDGWPSVPQFAPGRINNDDVWSLIDRAEAYNDPEIDARGEDGRWGTRIHATMRDGRVETAEVKYPKGGPKAPLSNEEIVAKYDRLTSLIMDRSVSEELKEIVLSLESQPDIEALSRILSADVKSPF